MIPHWHPEHELIYIKSGTLSLRLNDTQFVARAGDVIFVAGGTIHSGEPQGCVYTCILVELQKLLKKNDLCQDFAHLLQSRQDVVCTNLSERSAEFSRLCEEISKITAENKRGYPFTVKGLIFTLFGEMMDVAVLGENGRAAATDIAAEKIRGAISYMEQNCGEQIKLCDLAQTANLSTNHFLRLFKSVVGVTPFVYLADYRLAKAAHDLLSTDLSVTAVALSCGFNDASYFIHTFKRVYGVTPSGYRKRGI